MTIDVWAALADRLDPLGWRPELGDWVEVMAVDARGGRDVVMVGNSREFNYYRLDPAEAALLARMDGSRTVGDLVVEQLATGGRFDVGEVAGLVTLLREGGFLTESFVDVDGAIGRALAPTGWRVGVRHTLRTLSWEWSGAQRLTSALYRGGLRLLFGRIGAALAGLVAVLGLVAFVAVGRGNGFEFTPQSVGIGLVILFGLNLLLVFVHELGHAAYLVHRGRRVKGAGVRIYYGTPAFFIESSDVLMLGRRERMLQSFAGPYFELVATGAAALVLWGWPHGWLAVTLYRFVVLNYFVLLLNLIPLLELDGYWILTDLIRVPDLRPRSLAFMRHDLWHKLARRERFTRAELGLGLYGTVGVAFAVFCLVSAVFFWRNTFGGAVAKLWDLGPLGVVALFVFVGVLAGPLLGLLVQIVAAGYRRVRDASRQMRFRAQRRWRIEAAQLLDAQPLFDDLSVETLNDLAGRVQLRTVAAATAVVRQGDAADAYYLVRTGSLEVVEEDADAGVERVIHTLHAGESFGESGVATGARRTATVRAVTRAELFVVDKPTFDRLLADRIRLPDFAPTVQALAELRALPPFADLGNVDLDRLRQYGTWLAIAPDTAVVEEGRPGDAFYVIESGQVAVTRDGEQLAMLHAGEHFGETALLTHRPRNATVRTMTHSRMFRLDADNFHALVAQTFRRPSGVRNESVTFARE